MNLHLGYWWLGLVVALAPGEAQAQRTIILVRHAEKATTPPGADPPLSPSGQARAARLCEMLKDADVQTIFTSPFVRTKETAGPLAQALHLTPREDPMTNPMTLVQAVRALPGSGAVLIVGHSNTIPEFLKALGAAPISAIHEDEFDNLFVVTTEAATPPRLVRLHYKP